jgi:hypothetical protein
VTAALASRSCTTICRPTSCATPHRVAWRTYLPRLAVRAAGGDPGQDPHE